MKKNDLSEALIKKWNKPINWTGDILLNVYNSLLLVEIEFPIINRYTLLKSEREDKSFLVTAPKKYLYLAKNNNSLLLNGL